MKYNFPKIDLHLHLDGALIPVAIMQDEEAMERSSYELILSG